MRLPTTCLLLLAVGNAPSHAFAPHPPHRPSTLTMHATLPTALPDETDVIVIGSGLAGLSCAALLCNAYHTSVQVLESHDTPGGAAHTWTRRGFHFESGPSLYSGLSLERSPNPLKNIFQLCGQDCEWITYDRWGTVLPQGDRFAARIGPEEFQTVLLEQGGPEAVREFAALMERLQPLTEAAQALTSLALREDPAVVLTLLKYPGALLKTLSQGTALNEPFANILKEMNIQNEFVKNWLDMLCFLLQGLPAAGTMNAVMAYMLADFYRPGVTLDFPKGGSGAIVDALVRAIHQHSTSHVHVNSHVDAILVEQGRAVGVRLQNGRVLRARRAVVSNADPYVTNRLLSEARASGALKPDMIQYMDQLINTDVTTGGIDDLKSFIHLHAGINATGLPLKASADFPAQWAVIRDWQVGVEAPRNIVLCSVPSLLDPDMAPPGCHVLHAYVPATEPYSTWAGMNRTSQEYQSKKEEAADFLWKAMEEYLPHARERAILGTVQIGTPLTHERFLRRTRGSYGPRVEVGSGPSLPGHTTPLAGLYLVGDYTFPGIGVPATAASGAIAANTIGSVWDHLAMLDRIRLPKK
jgi:phytoene dehydrogenase-like protein